MKTTKRIAIVMISIALLATPAQAQETGSYNQQSRPDFESLTSYSIWNGGYDKKQCEVIIGYVNKSWRCTYPNGVSEREDFFGDSEDKYLHGWHIGALYTPSFDWGLGLRTGMFFEFYTSRSRWITSYCNHFTEVDMYIPLHASFRLPITEDCGLTLYGGMGFQWAMDGRYYKYVGSFWPWGRRPMPVYNTYKQEYGNGWPKRVNWQAECGLNFRFKMVALNFTYSFGIVEHEIQNTFDNGKTYITATKSRQDKMEATLSFIL